MTRSLFRAACVLAIAGAASLVISAQAARTQRSAAPVVSTSERAVPFHAGEQLSYDVSWSAMVTAATATLTVKEKRGGPAPAYYIVAEGRPAPMITGLYNLYYKLDTLLDAATLLPARGSVYSEEGARHRYRVTQFNRPARTASFSVQTTTTVNSTVAIPPDAQDALSVVYLLRTRPLKTGLRETIPVSDGGSLYRVAIEVQAPEQVRTPAGDMRAWRVVPSVTDANGQPVGRNLMLWLSDDERKVPVRFKADLPVGTFDLILREAR